MKILLCHNFYKVSGGAEVFFHEVARVLEDRGHSVAMLCVKEDKIDSPWSKYFPERVDYKKNKLKASIHIKNLIYSSKAKKAASELVKVFER